MRIINSPDDSVVAYQNLALQRDITLIGRFARIAANAATIRSEVTSQFWTDIVRPHQLAVRSGATPDTARHGLAVFKAASKVIDYPYPIILNMVPDQTGGLQPYFSKGWLPQKVAEKAAVNEYVLISKASIGRLVNLLDTLNLT